MDSGSPTCETFLFVAGGYIVVNHVLFLSFLESFFRRTQFFVSNAQCIPNFGHYVVGIFVNGKLWHEQLELVWFSISNWIMMNEVIRII